MYSEIDVVSRYINVNVKCFYSQVDAKNTNIPNVSNIVWFQAILDQLLAIGDITDAEKIIYDGLVVDGYEFGHAVISQINSSIFSGPQE